MSTRAHVRSSFRDNLFEMMLGLMMLGLLYGWDVWPRWATLAMAWLAAVLGFVCAVIGGVWLLVSEQPQ